MAKANGNRQAEKPKLNGGKVLDGAPIPEGWDDLETVRSGIDLGGFFSPRDVGPKGQHVYGTLVRYVERRSPTPSQAAGFVILILAAPVPGLVFSDGRGDDSEEGILEAGTACGIDIRTSYSMLRDPAHEGKRVHLFFKGKKVLGDGRTFWDVDVSLQKKKVEPTASDDIPF